MCIAVCVFYMMIRALVFTGSTCGLIYSLALRTFRVRGIRFAHTAGEDNPAAFTPLGTAPVFYPAIV